MSIISNSDIDRSPHYPLQVVVSIVTSLMLCSLVVITLMLLLFLTVKLTVIVDDVDVVDTVVVADQKKK